MSAASELLSALRTAFGYDDVDDDDTDTKASIEDIAAKVSDAIIDYVDSQVD